jgi:DNA-nicking Smr family endonuclease
MSQGLYRKAWNKSELIDLHDLPASVARAVLRAVLNDLKTGKRLVADIKVVTGRGKRSPGGKPAVPKDIGAFLQKCHGPKITAEAFFSGHFYLTKVALEEWLGRASTEAQHHNA